MGHTDSQDLIVKDCCKFILLKKSLSYKCSGVQACLFSPLFSQISEEIRVPEGKYTPLWIFEAKGVYNIGTWLHRWCTSWEAKQGNTRQPRVWQKSQRWAELTLRRDGQREEVAMAQWWGRYHTAMSWGCRGWRHRRCNTLARASLRGRAVSGQILWLLSLPTHLSLLNPDGRQLPASRSLRWVRRRTRLEPQNPSQGHKKLVGVYSYPSPLVKFNMTWGGAVGAGTN